MAKLVVELKDICPVTGLSVNSPPEWTDVSLSINYSSSFILIGENIVYTVPVGLLSTEGISAFYIMHGKFLEAVGLSNQPYVEIRDNSEATGIPSRKIWMQVSSMIMGKIATEGLSGFWMFNSSLYYKYVYNAGIFQKKPSIPMKAVDSYAHVVSGIKGSCTRAGMNDYLSKPLKRDGLISMADKWTCIKASENPKKLDGELNPEVLHLQILVGLGKDPINIGQALEEFGDDKLLLNTVLDEFLGTVGGQIPIIYQAIAVKDAQKLILEAHSIKGGAANLIADDLSKAAKLFEEMGLANDFINSVQVLESFEKEYFRLKNYALSSLT
jgi:HPt (histidine-containing phosphotransfer) domain-containing protein